MKFRDNRSRKSRVIFSQYEDNTFARDPGMPEIIPVNLLSFTGKSKYYVINGSTTASEIYS